MCAGGTKSGRQAFRVRNLLHGTHGRLFQPEQLPARRLGDGQHRGVLEPTFCRDCVEPLPHPLERPQTPNLELLHDVLLDHRRTHEQAFSAGAERVQQRVVIELPDDARPDRARLEPLIQAAPQGRAALPTAKLKILLVEDNAVNQMLALGMLQKLGLNADLATDGAEAVERVRETSYDLILMDMQMPRMDGLTATRAIRAMPELRQPRIVALTANAMESDRDACLAAGMDDFLSKPFKAAELQEKLVAPASAAAKA